MCVDKGRTEQKRGFGKNQRGLLLVIFASFGVY